MQSAAGMLQDGREPSSGVEEIAGKCEFLKWAGELGDGTCG